MDTAGTKNDTATTAMTNRKNSEKQQLKCLLKFLILQAPAKFINPFVIQQDRIVQQMKGEEYAANSTS